MKILATIAEAQALPNAKRRVLVPTMGALHKAHGELIRVARQAAGKDGEVAVSIFGVIRAPKRLTKNFAGMGASISYFVLRSRRFIQQVVRRS